MHEMHDRYIDVLASNTIEKMILYAKVNRGRGIKFFPYEIPFSEGESKNLNFIKTLRASISCECHSAPEIPICEWQKIRVRYVRHSTAWKAEIDQVIICSALSTIMYVHYVFATKCVRYTSYEYRFSHVVTINTAPGHCYNYIVRVHILSILRLAPKGHLNWD